MNTPDHSKGNPTPEEFELSQDKELWELLGQSKTEEANPLLSRNVLREIRLQESNSATRQLPRLLHFGANFSMLASFSQWA